MKGPLAPSIRVLDPAAEVMTDERCAILESWGAQDDPVVSLARARVTRGGITAWHALDGVDERYIIVAGRGLMEVGDFPPTEVGPGDTVVIPAGVRQRITALGDDDLIFYCVCTPPFTPACYRSLEPR